MIISIAGYVKEAVFSQESFADRRDVHRTYLGSVERGETNISLDNAEAPPVADILPTRQEEAPSPNAAKGPVFPQCTARASNTEPAD